VSKFGEYHEGSANAKLADAHGRGGGRLPPRPKLRNETAELTKPIEAALNAIPGVWAARNNSGQLPAVVGGGRIGMVRYGLGIGSPDIIGTIHQDGVAVAFGLEVKWPDKQPKPQQVAWAEAQRRKGWIVEIVHSVPEALAVVERMRGGV
jgi:hypothetical protein